MKENTHKPSYLNFNKNTYKWKPDIDYRHHPEKYYVGKGEQGVLICEPYKSELVKYWRFKTPQIAEESSQAIFKMFLKYIDKNEFVGADMARKFLQMGFTRARRYTNYKGGQKYDKKDYHILEKGTGDQQKAISANIFYKAWKAAEENEKYKKIKLEWKSKFG